MANSSDPFTENLCLALRSYMLLGIGMWIGLWLCTSTFKALWISRGSFSLPTLIHNKWQLFFFKKIINEKLKKISYFFICILPNYVFHRWNHQRIFTKVCFDTLEGSQRLYFKNGYFFKILWWFHEAHN